MKRVIFKAIIDRLKAELNTPEVLAIFPALTHFDRFRNQFAKEDQENLIPKPAILVELVPHTWKDQSQGVQEAQLDIKLHIGQASYATFQDGLTNEEQALLTFDYLELVHQALHNYSHECFTNLTRVAEGEDTNHDHIVVDTLTYRTTILDTSAATNRKKTSQAITFAVLPKED
jgi:hypothetical protein